MDSEKVCRTCGTLKDINDFYRNKGTADGRLNHCKICVNQVNKKYKEKNREVIIQWKREWNSNNKEKHEEYYRENSKRIIKRVSDYNKIYHQTEKGREMRLNALTKRRANKYNVEFSPYQRKKILERDNWECQLCKCKVHDRHTGNWNTPDKAHIDHVIPLSKGGSSKYENIQVLCRTCNLKKHNKLNLILGGCVYESTESR